MQKLYCGSLEVELADDTADLLWAYHSALCERGRSDTVEVPVCSFGVPLRLRLTLSPSTPLAILPVPGFLLEPPQGDTDLLDVMRLQLALLDSEDEQSTAA